MAGSRLEKVGSVFTRIRDLLRSGVLNESQKPCWYDVYAAFPPTREPVYQKPKERFARSLDPVQEIFYQEDMIRAKFYEVYGNGPRAFDLARSNFISTCQRFVEKYRGLQEQGEVDDGELFDATSKALLADGIILRRRAGARVLPSDSHQEAVARSPVLDFKLQDMLKDMQEGGVEERKEADLQPGSPEPATVSGATVSGATRTGQTGGLPEH